MINIAKVIGRAIAAIVLCFSGILGSLHLKSSYTISEPTFVLFILTSIMVGLIVFFSDRVTHFSFGFKKIEVTLQEIQKTEASVKELAAATLDVFEKKSFGIMQNGYDADAYNRAADRLRKLIA